MTLWRFLSVGTGFKPSTTTGRMGEVPKNPSIPNFGSHSKFTAGTSSGGTQVASPAPQPAVTAQAESKAVVAKRVDAAKRPRRPLESVKVVRNDLSDTDIEVVSVKAVRAIPSLLKSQADAKQKQQTEFVGSLWNRITAGVFASAKPPGLGAKSSGTQG